MPSLPFIFTKEFCNELKNSHTPPESPTSTPTSSYEKFPDPNQQPGLLNSSQREPANDAAQTSSYSTSIMLILDILQSRLSRSLSARGVDMKAINEQCNNFKNSPPTPPLDSDSPAESGVSNKILAAEQLYINLSKFRALLKANESFKTPDMKLPWGTFEAYLGVLESLALINDKVYPESGQGEFDTGKLRVKGLPLQYQDSIIHFSFKPKSTTTLYNSLCPVLRKVTGSFKVEGKMPVKDFDGPSKGSNLSADGLRHQRITSQITYQCLMAVAKSRWGTCSAKGQHKRCTEVIDAVTLLILYWYLFFLLEDTLPSGQGEREEVKRACREQLNENTRKRIDEVGNITSAYYTVIVETVTENRDLASESKDAYRSQSLSRAANGRYDGNGTGSPVIIGGISGGISGESGTRSRASSRASSARRPETLTRIVIDQDAGCRLRSCSPAGAPLKLKAPRTNELRTGTSSGHRERTHSAPAVDRECRSGKSSRRSSVCESMGIMESGYQSSRSSSSYGEGREQSRAPRQKPIREASRMREQI